MKRFFKKVRTFTNDVLYKGGTISCVIILLIAVVPELVIDTILKEKGIKILREESLLLFLVGPLFLVMLNCIAKLYLAIKISKEQGISIKEAWEQS